jgi:prepilin-type N-terminal cleavage/methylation domain-containing protein
MQQRQLVGKYKCYAFTLIELMTVIVVVALLITAAIPSFSDFVRNNQAMVAADRLVSSLRLAKGEAIRLGIPVTVCPISSSFNPTTAPSQSTEEYPCQNTTNWSAWKVFTDPDFNATEDFADGWPVLEYTSNRGSAVITSNISAPITFDPMGFANVNPATTRSGWTWSSSYSSGEWDWSYSYASAYGGTYYRVFNVAPTGCTGNNARVVEVTQNGVIKISNADC